MAAPNARMRLSVEILPLELDERQVRNLPAAHLEALKGRKFALPVQLDDTFEQVWTQVEERYKRNYLTQTQAANFTIKKLQDAYDCDLDLSDTVAAIFEGETDSTKRLIKVVPSLLNRDFSVPVSSNLRPVQAQKRARQHDEEAGNKRRRLEHPQAQIVHLDRIQDEALPSTESPRGSDFDLRQNRHGRRSQSHASVQYVQGSQTGHQEYSVVVKEESPELGLPNEQIIAESDLPVPSSSEVRFKSSSLLGSPLNRRGREASVPESVQETLREQPSHSPSPSRTNQINDGMEDVIMERDDRILDVKPGAGLENEIGREPDSMPSSNGSDFVTRMPAPRDMYEMRETPEFARRPAKKLQGYGNASRTRMIGQSITQSSSKSRSPTNDRKAVNGSLVGSRGIIGKARFFQAPEADEIVSTPDRDVSEHPFRRAPPIPDSNGTPTPVITEAPKSTKASSLKRPLMRAYPMGPPSSAKRKISTPEARRVSGTGPATPVPNDDSSPRRKIDILKQKLQQRKLEQNQEDAERRRESTSSAGSARRKSIHEQQQETGKMLQGPTMSTPRGDRSSPKVVIPPGRNHSASAIAQGEPRPPSQVPVPPSTSRKGHVSNADVPSANDPSSDSKKSLSKVNEGTTQLSKPAVAVGLQNQVSRSTPKRSEIPLPDNVRHLVTKTAAAPFIVPPKTLGTKATKRIGNVTKEETSERDSIQASNVAHVAVESKRVADAPNHHGRPKKVNNGLSASSLATTLQGTVNQVDERNADVSNEHTITAISPPPHADITSEPNNASVKKKQSPSSEKPPSSSQSVLPQSRNEVDRALKPDASLSSHAEELIIVPSDVSDSSSNYSSEEDAGVDTSTSTALRQTDGEDFDRSYDRAQQKPSQLDHNGNLQDQPEDVEMEEPQTNQSPELSMQKLSEDSLLQSQILQDNRSSDERNTSPRTLWTSQSWGFGPHVQEKPITDENTDKQSEAEPSQDIRLLSPRSSREGSEVEDEADSRSRSVSGVASNRSSPAIPRKPARLLSRTPSPVSSGSEDEAAPSPDKASVQESDQEKQTESDEESSSDETSTGTDTDTEDEDEDVEDTTAESNGNAHTGAKLQIQSSPPLPQQSRAKTSSAVPLPASQPSLPTTSSKRVPLPPTRAESRTPGSAPRNPSRFTAFPTIKQQLTQARSNATTGAKREAFDPKTMSLSRLTKAKTAMKKNPAAFADDSDSDAESSSSSGSSDSDTEVVKKVIKKVEAGAQGKGKPQVKKAPAKFPGDSESDNDSKSSSSGSDSDAGVANKRNGNKKAALCQVA